jgi:hypothetical protein
MRIAFVGLVALLFTGCTATTAAPPESQQQSEVSAPMLPVTTGSFAGHYVVPAPPDIASAATFAMPEADWTVAGGVATLHYELPVGLVGGTLPVTLSGPIAANATTVALTSSAGSGTCTASGTLVTCTEVFGELGTLPISEAVVAQVAATEYPGPVANRTAVADVFSSDPIGTISFDVAAPADDGGGHGSGGGGHGHH